MDETKDELLSYVWNLTTSKNVGYKLPSETQLAIKFKINRMVAREMYKKLEILNVIFAIPKKGYYVADNLNHSKTFNYFNYEKKSVEKIDKLPTFLMKKLRQVYPVLPGINYLNFKNFAIYKKIFISAQKIINTTYLVLNKKFFNLKIDPLQLKLSIIAYLKTQKKITSVLNTIIGNTKILYKISIFLRKNGGIGAITITLVKPQYIMERYIKKII